MQLELARAPVDLAPFERRLKATDAAPVAVAFSGGGDSLALLLAARRWADRAGRRLIVLTVDHRLQPDGARWAELAGERARRLGLEHRTLRWDGEKPAGGLPAAARMARHCLLAGAARAAGARVILLGHTADDLIEAQLMRSFGSNVPSPREWSPSPVWPEGRGIFLLRPLLTARRADLRAWLAGEGERWIEDPANDDPRFARTLARRRLARSEAAAAPEPPRRLSASDALADVTFGEGGEFTLPRTAFDRSAPEDAEQRLAALCLCASGGSMPPRGAALGRLLRRLAAPGAFTASLAGARIEAGEDRLLICREAGEFQRTDVGPVSLPEGESVFDGRFALIADESGWRLRPLQGVAKHLPAAQRARLARLPASVRAGLPVVTAAGREPCCPILAQDAPIRAFALGGERLLAALGGIPDEASLACVAKLRWGA